MKITVELEKEDFTSLHDVIFESLGFDPSIPQIEKCWDLLPENEKGLAYQWGVDDTVFRDNAYEWFEDNKEEVLAKLKYLELL